ncbi:hypothetical protein PAMP_023998 [Pampus punctatissimus]
MRRSRGKKVRPDKKRGEESGKKERRKGGENKKERGHKRDRKKERRLGNMMKEGKGEERQKKGGGQRKGGRSGTEGLDESRLQRPKAGGFRPATGQQSAAVSQSRNGFHRIKKTTLPGLEREKERGFWRHRFEKRKKKDVM